MRSPGQEAETLARLHGGARQDDARDLALDEGRHGHRHREIGLARPRGTDGDHQIVTADGVEIPLLIQCLRCDLLAPRGHGDGLGEKSLHVGRRLRGGQPQRRPDLGGAQ